MGLATTLLAAGLSLVPPPGVHSVWLFELKTIGGTALAVGAAFYRVDFRSRPA